MKFFKLTLVCSSVLSLAGCITAPTNPDTNTQPALSQAYVDLLVEKAKAEERARVMAELAQQNKDDKRFSDIKISQLESKVNQLSERAKEPEEIQQETLVVEPVESSSADPLLDQWKQMYAQQDDVPEPVVETVVEPIIEVESTTIKTAPAAPKAISSDKIVAEILQEAANGSQLNTEQQQEVSSAFKEETPVLHSPEVVMDTVIRQCFAGQNIPDPYLGTLPEILDASAQPGDVLRLPTLCKWSRTHDIITQLQIALSERGFLKPSPPFDLEVIDGIWGVNTLNSLINFQKSKGIAYGQLSIESLVELGVIQYSDVVNRSSSQVNAAPKVKVVPKVEAKLAAEKKVELKPKKEITPEPGANITFQTAAKVSVEPEVKAEEKIEQNSEQKNKPQTAKQNRSDSNHCYVNQVICNGLINL